MKIPTITDEQIATARAKFDAVLARHREQQENFGVWLPGGALMAEPTRSYLRVEDIQTCVNRLQYQSDWLTHKARDVWETPREFYKRGHGDCEEFALCKALMLTELGHPAWFALCIDRGKSNARHVEWHAVCLVGDAFGDDKIQYDNPTPWTEREPNDLYIKKAPDTRLVLDLPNPRMRGGLKAVSFYEMAGVYKFDERLIWRVE